MIYFLQEISEELEVEFDDKELDLLVKLAGEDGLVIIIISLSVMLILIYGDDIDIRSATQNLAQTRKGKKTAGKDFKFF